MTTKKFKTESIQFRELSYGDGMAPPQAKELESAVLGAIMLEKHAYDLAADILNADCFYSEANKNVFMAMQQLVEKNRAIDLMTVVDQLQKMELLQITGGPYYVSKLTNAVVSSANIEEHALIVKQKYMLRELSRIGANVSTLSYKDSTDVFELMNKAESDLSSLIAGNHKKQFESLASGMVKNIARIEELKAKGQDVTGVPTGFDSLDKLTHGWQNTDLIILAARPSVGKSAFALNLADAAAKSYQREFDYNQQFGKKSDLKSVVFFSLEMSAMQLRNRLLSAHTEILLDKITTGKLDDGETLKLYSPEMQQYMSLPIFIDDTASLSIFELRAKARRLKNKHNLGLIIVDYLQLMSGGIDNRNGNREQEISKISRDLKALAKELEVPVIALSQLSRETEKRTGDKKIPQLSDLRESGAIEQDADMVMFLYRPEYYEITANEMGESNKGETHVKIAKHRNGSLDTIKLKALLHIQKFVEYEDAGFTTSSKKPWIPSKVERDPF